MSKFLPALFFLALALAACDSVSTDDAGDGSSFVLAALTCDVAGVNADPFTVADALAENAADHEVAGDYTYDAALATTITLNGTSAAVTGSGATAIGSVVTVSAPGTYVVSGTLTDGQVIVDSPDDGLSIGGSGTLTVTASFEDGIASKDGLVIADGTITVTAPDEGIRGKDYLVVRGGTLDVTAGGDGLKSDEDADLGYLLITGGTITVDADADAVTAETDALLTGGTLALRSGGGASVTPDDETSTKGFKAGVLAVIDDGTLTIDASDDGVHSDLEMTINGGDLTITQSYEGIESVLGDLVVNGGTLDITATDDGMNLSGDGDDPNGVEGEADPYDMVFNGGWVTITSGNDGIDSNGSIVMTGGCLAIDGPTPGTRPEQGAIDYNGDFEITGGVLVAAGAAGRMAQTPSVSSTQPTVAVTFSSAQSAGTAVALDGNGHALAAVPGKTFQSLVVSAPWLSTGGTVRLYRGGTVTGSATDGLFNGGTLSGGTLLETVTLSSSVTSVTP